MDSYFFFFVNLRFFHANFITFPVSSKLKSFVQVKPKYEDILECQHFKQNYSKPPATDKI